MVVAPGGGPNGILEAYSWGANPSRLIKALDEGHYDVKLDADEMERLTAWIDLNAPYYSTYASAWDRGAAGRGPLDGGEVNRLKSLTGKGIRLGHGAAPMISFDRPELSPILADVEKRNPAAYSEALALIETGRQRLTEKPRADMPGFAPCPTDQARLDKYARLQNHQQRIRAAIRAGKKVHDRDLQR